MQKQKFIRPEHVLLEAGLKPEMFVADLGVGSGFFTLPASVIVGDQGRIWAVDVLESALSKVSSSARLQGRKNIRTLRHNLDGYNESAIEELSCDLAVIGKVLPQMKHPENLVRETYRILKTGGKVVIVEWKKEHTKLGPPYEMRIAPEKAKEIFTAKGFKFLRELEPDGFHYALLLEK
ncbi:MAG: class I SAM-dependent methyltransferase [Candidatus Doudnabacteria bacterium]|nr:class I SAM-dependent methyltransferase [Candidatus Doudnabacteria bacterium]